MRGRSLLTFECHGAVVSVRPDHAELLDLIRPLLPPDASAVRTGPADVRYEWARDDRAGRGDRHLVTVRDPSDARPAAVACAGDAAVAAAELARDAEFRIALHARGRVFVHAAAVAWRGRAVVMPGRSMAGKTTLAAALVRCGAAYLSDEYAVLDECGRVHPFPRRLRLRDPSGRPAGTVAAEELGGVTAAHAYPVGFVVCAHYDADAVWRPHPLSAGQTALALLANTPVARARPAYALRLIARALDGAIGLRGPRGEADVTAPLILARAADRGPDDRGPDDRGPDDPPIG